MNAGETGRSGGSWAWKVDHLDGGAGNDTITVSSMFGGGNHGSTYWGDKIVNFETINFYGPFDIGSQLGTAGETINIVNSGSGYGTTTLTSSSNANITYTGAGAETVILGSGNDTVNLNQSDDTVNGGAGNDTIDGGDGIDIAIFSGDKSNYTITETDMHNIK